MPLSYTLQVHAFLVAHRVLSIAPPFCALHCFAVQASAARMRRMESYASHGRERTWTPMTPSHGALRSAAVCRSPTLCVIAKTLLRHATITPDSQAIQQPALQMHLLWTSGCWFATTRMYSSSPQSLLSTSSHSRRWSFSQCCKQCAALRHLARQSPTFPACRSPPTTAQAIVRVMEAQTLQRHLLAAFHPATSVQWSAGSAAHHSALWSLAPIRRVCCTTRSQTFLSALQVQH
jgi:hypothetical protein